jgi:hypothetical protein
MRCFLFGGVTAASQHHEAPGARLLHELLQGAGLAHARLPAQKQEVSSAQDGSDALLLLPSRYQLSGWHSAEEVAGRSDRGVDIWGKTSSTSMRRS